MAKDCTAMIIQWVLLVAIGALVSVAALVWLAPGQRNKHSLIYSSNWRDASDPVWLFDDSQLIDASRDARKQIGETMQGYDWSNFYADLHLRFPGFPKTPQVVQEAETMVIPSPDAAMPGDIRFEWLDGLIRVQIQVPDANASDPVLAKPLFESHELTLLRTSLKQAPYPIWFVDDSRDVSWFNQAFEDLCLVSSATEDCTKSPFDISDVITQTQGLKRKSTAVKDGDGKLWFDVSAVPYQDGHLLYAVDVNAIVEAELAQRKFVQTLAKTFAQLSIGLAIFDRNRQLALFNPALIDLTTLPADFLSARPNLLSFFDRMRDQGTMPEPKNYASWRQEISDLVEAAADGRYQETWTLPSGSVHSVSGRPHPDGAIAFLFEDITAEITLTRRFRSELELSQSLLDQLDDAIAVFSADGTLTISNAAYHQLWSVDHDLSFAKTSVLDATRIWQEQSAATPAWGDIRDFVTSRENRAEWWSEIRLNNGDRLSCHVHPVSKGATLVRFVRPATAKLPELPDTHSKVVIG